LASAFPLDIAEPMKELPLPSSITHLANVDSKLQTSTDIRHSREETVKYFKHAVQSDLD